MSTSGQLFGRVRAVHLAELTADLPHEVGRLPVGRDLLEELDRLDLGRLVLGRRVLGAGQRTARLHEVEDVVAALDDLGGLGHDELEVRALLAFGDVVQADLLGVADEVELGRRLGDRGEDRVLGEGQLVERLAEVALGRGLHAVALVAVEVLVEVGGDDLLLARLAGRERLGQADRLDDLARLALVDRAVERLGREEAGADELLGDRRGAAGLARQRVEPGRHDADRVEAGVRPEVLVLDRGRRVDDLARQLVEGDELALQVAESGELDLAGPVVDDRLLLELDVRERRDGVGQAGRVLVVGADGDERTGPGDQAGRQDEHDEDDEEDLPDGRSGMSLRLALERLSTALAPREAGLHLWPHDSIGGVKEPFAASRMVETARRSSL